MWNNKEHKKSLNIMIIKIEYNSEILQLNSKFHSVGPSF